MQNVWIMKIWRTLILTHLIWYWMTLFHMLVCNLTSKNWNKDNCKIKISRLLITIQYKLINNEIMRGAMKLLMFKMKVFSFKLNLLMKIKIRKAILISKYLIIEILIHIIITEIQVFNNSQVKRNKNKNCTIS